MILLFSSDWIPYFSIGPSVSRRMSVRIYILIWSPSMFAVMCNKGREIFGIFQRDYLDGSGGFDLSGFASDSAV